MIRDWWMLIRFVCFVFQGSVLCDRPVSENNQLVQFASQIIISNLSYSCHLQQ